MAKIKKGRGRIRRRSGSSSWFAKKAHFHSSTNSRQAKCSPSSLYCCSLGWWSAKQLQALANFVQPSRSNNGERYLDRALELSSCPRHVLGRLGLRIRPGGKRILAGTFFATVYTRDNDRLSAIATKKLHSL